jgi:predicted dehydrogenase
MSGAVKVGIVGINGYGRVLLDELLSAKRDGAAVVEVAVVRSPEKNAEALAHLKELSPETRVFSSLDEVIAANVNLDLMVLPTGISAHREQTLAVLDAGWNVLVEKPLAGCLEDAEAMARAAQQSDRFAAVGFQDMYAAHMRPMKETLLSGAIGEVYSIRAFGIWGRSVDYFKRNAWAGKLFYNGQPVYDSPFNNALAHYLNMALFLAGRDLDSPATPVKAEGALRRAHAIESCDTACLRWETDGGPEVSVFFSHASTAPSDPELVAEGSRGTLCWKLNSPWELHIKGEPVQSHQTGTLEQFRKRMMRQVLQRVHDPKVPIFTVRQALAQVQAVALAHACTEICDFPARLVNRSVKPDKKGQMQEWVEVQGVHEEGRRFIDGSVADGAPRFWESSPVFSLSN